ncbi:hypothetical protein ACWC09_38730 [Streptomyces sp. NPDC001617]
MGVEVRSTVALKDVLRKVETGWSPVCDSARPATDEWGVLKLSAVTSGKFVASEAKRLPSEVLPRTAFEVRPGDVLMSRANGVKALVGVACTVNQVRPRLLLPDLVFRLVADPDVLDPGFLGIVLTSAAARRQIEAAMRGTSGQYKVSQADVRALGIPQLPLPEQRDIVAAHEAFERRIGALARELAKLRVVEQAVVAQTMAEATRRVDLSQCLIDIESGWSPACDAEQPDVDEWGVVKVSAVTSGRFIDGEAKRLPMGQVQRPELEIKKGDVLLARANGARSLVGVSCYVTATRPRLMLSDKLLRLIPDRTAVDPVYLAILLGTPGVRRQIGNLLNGGTGQNNITQADVRALKVPQLPLPEQRDVVAAHEAFERRIGMLERELTRLRVTQRAVVEDLLSGRSRVTRT